MEMNPLRFVGYASISAYMMKMNMIKQEGEVNGRYEEKTNEQRGND